MPLVVSVSHHPAKPGDLGGEGGRNPWVCPACCPPEDTPRPACPTYPALAASWPGRGRGRRREAEGQARPEPAETICCPLGWGHAGRVNTWGCSSERALDVVWKNPQVGLHQQHETKQNKKLMLQRLQVLFIDTMKQTWLLLEFLHPQEGHTNVSTEALHT